jgi:hypothetical protein
MSEHRNSSNLPSRSRRRIYFGCGTYEDWRDFWFNQGNAPRGREAYRESVKLPDDSDQARVSVADTYLMWAAAEEEHGYGAEANRVREMGLTAARRIDHPRMRDNMVRQLSKGDRSLTDDVAKGSAHQRLES